ncbi:MAG: O-antigen ligase family protein [Bacteroidales bacterium]
MNFLGISSPIDLTLLLSIFLVIDVLIYAFRKKKIMLSKYIIISIITLLLFYFLLIISKIYSPSHDYALKKIFYFNLNIIAYLYPLLKSNFNLKKFIKLLIYVGLFFGIINLLYFGLYLSKIIDYQQFSKVSGDYIGIGILLGLNVILLSFPEIKKLFKGETRLVFYFLSIVLLLFSGARGPILFTLITLFFLYVFQKNNINLTIFRIVNIKRFIVFLIGIILIIVVIILFKDVFFLVSKRYIQLIEGFVFGKSSGGYDLRKEYIDFVLIHSRDGFLEFFFGHGVGSFGYYFLGEDIELYPHNLILEILFELGICGILLFVVFVIFSINNQFKNRLILYSIFFIFLNSLKSFSIIELRMLFGLLAIINLKIENESR